VKAGDTIGSYVLERRLGRGVTASTWLARRAQPDSGSGAESPLVLKIFDIAETDSWKPLDQFKREADILRTLSHPRIPKYI
jgi:serine/threonine protein kinase